MSLEYRGSSRSPVQHEEGRGAGQSSQTGQQSTNYRRLDTADGFGRDPGTSVAGRGC